MVNYWRKIDKCVDCSPEKAFRWNIEITKPDEWHNYYSIAQITELKAKNFTSETELRNKMKTSEKEYEAKISNMQHKISTLLKEVASLSKTSKRGDRVAATKTEAGTNSGSGTDSPVLPW